VSRLRDPRHSRAVVGTVTSRRTLEGGGVEVRRPFPTPGLGEVDPFLLLDHVGPLQREPGARAELPGHPHAGFEVVSYLLRGTAEHRDSGGHRGRVSPGGVQWMTAGAGIVHAESLVADEAGVIESIQLWVNLPREHKRMAPRYEDVLPDDVPVATSADGRATGRVLAGEALGVRKTLGLVTPLTCVHWTIEPGARVEPAIVPGDRALAYVLRGDGRFGPEGTRADAQRLVLFADEGDTVTLAAPPDARAPLEALVLAAPPIREPIARYGPFVLNTSEEIRRAIEDFESGRMGRIPADGDGRSGA
jgi:redox-sensitive bicupin YhaK (pirin superfamily)